MPAKEINEALLGDPWEMAGSGDGASGEALSLSWQGDAGGDSEVRFVVGIHFPWLSRGWGELLASAM